MRIAFRATPFTRFASPQATSTQSESEQHQPKTVDLSTVAVCNCNQTPLVNIQSARVVNFQSARTRAAKKLGNDKVSVCNRVCGDDQQYSSLMR